MMIPLLLFLMAFEPQQQLEQQMQRQQQQLEQVNRQLEQQGRQLERMIGVLERQPDRRDPKPIAVCSVEARRVNGKDGKLPGLGPVFALNLFSSK